MKASLSSERWEQVHRLFNEVVDLTLAAREARLDETCRIDPLLRDEVESLLAAYAQADDLLQVLDQIGGSPSTPSAVAGPSYTGTRVAHYEVLEKLGGGGMGVVYKAHDTRLKRIVALKFLPPQWSEDARAKQRFVHEAQAASALDHPNICTIYEIGEATPPSGAPGEGQLFIAMAYYEGETLKKKIAPGPLPLDEALDCVVQIARGLAKAHAQGIVHRDVKPANIMMTDDGVVKIVDFGLAKMADVQLTKTGATMGTVAYMSPEQARGDKVDHRTDLWSLGVVLYEMLAGERPFKGEYDQAIIYSLLNEDPVSITERNAVLPEELEHVMAMSLEKDRDLRYPTMTDLLADLEVLTQSTGSNPAVGTSMSLYATRRRQPRVSRKAVMTGVGAALALAILLAIPSVRQAVFSGFGQPALPTQRYLAVLPFSFADADLETDQAFADGLVETFRNKFAQLEQYQDSLWVVPAEDIAAYPVASPDEARQLFGVNLAVEGQIERIEEVVRLTLTLVETKTLEELRSFEVEGQGVQDATFQAGLLTMVTDLLEVDLPPQIRRSLSAGETAKSQAYVYYLQGRGYLRRYEQSDQVETAIALFNQARQEDPTYALAYAGLGEAYWRKFKNTLDTRWIEEAETYCEQALELNRDLAPVYVTQGLIHTERGQYGSAQVMFDLAQERDPTYAAAYRGLAEVYEEQGRLDDAEATYQKAITLKRDYWGGYFDLGNFYRRKGRYREALAQFQHVIDLTPDNYLGYSKVGVQYYYLGRRDSAKAMYERSLQVKHNFDAFKNLAHWYYLEEDYERAAPMYKEMLATQDTDYRIWGYLANSYYWIGEQTKAREAWQTMIEMAEEHLALNSRDADVLGDLAGASSKIGAREQAFSYIERLLDLKRQDRGTLFDVARYYEVLGERDLALQYLKEALENGLTLVLVEDTPWLEDLREDPDYKEIIEPYQEMRE